MHFIVDWTLTFVAGLLCIPAAVLLLEVIAALPSPKQKSSEVTNTNGGDHSGSAVAIIVPAHNESAGILPTIRDITPQLGERDRLLVVADNCSDNTAEVAASAGAEVISRTNSEKVGKGYALDEGIRCLDADPPDFVIFIDADCRIQSDMIQRLKDVCHKLQRPVQATFLMTSPDNSSVDHRVAEFAWIVRNWVRPLGLRHLNCPIQLMGTGMIFPWKIISLISMATSNLVEDLKLGLGLAAAGKAPQFYPFVIGTSSFPQSAKASYSQRQRWEHGHIGMIVQNAPRMLVRAARKLNFDLFVLTLDMAVPPLSLLGMLIAGIFSLSAIGAVFGATAAALVVSSAALAAYFLAVVLAWLKFGRDILPLRSLWKIGGYVFRKFRLYVEILSGKAATKWIRTDRAVPK